MTRWFDPRRMLALPAAYSLFSNLVNPPSRKRRFVAEDLRVVEGERVLDIGCGPAELLGIFPDVDYVGFDADPAYIESAQVKYAERRAEFHCALATQANIPRPGIFDRVMAVDLLHHLDGASAKSLFELGCVALRPGGRIITLDCVRTDGNGSMAHWTISRDRGEHIRNMNGYSEIASASFGEVRPVIRSDLKRNPDARLMLECTAA